jgi:hypothetical protein
MKRCPRCEQEKLLDMFGRDKHRKDGKNTWCKSCVNDASREYRESFPERRLATARTYRESNVIKLAGARRRYTFGLSIEEVDSLIEAQGNACKLCRGDLGESWQVDHDHACCPSKIKTCGKCVRGVLCRRCNIGLGHFRDNPELLIAASLYVSERADRLALAGLLDEL